MYITAAKKDDVCFETIVVLLLERMIGDSVNHFIGFPRQDAANEISAELQGRPDLIIGNYSDGNLVASLLAHKLGVTQV